MRKSSTRETAKMVTELKAACPNCGSTERAPVHNTRTLKANFDINGIHYTRVTLSYTKCLHCGQVYIVRKYEAEKLVQNVRNPEKLHSEILATTPEIEDNTGHERPKQQHEQPNAKTRAGSAKGGAGETAPQARKQ